MLKEQLADVITQVSGAVFVAADQSQWTLLRTAAKQAGQDARGAAVKYSEVVKPVLDEIRKIPEFNKLTMPATSPAGAGLALHLNQI